MKLTQAIEITKQKRDTTTSPAEIQKLDALIVKLKKQLEDWKSEQVPQAAYQYFPRMCENSMEDRCQAFAAARDQIENDFSSDSTIVHAAQNREDQLVTSALYKRA